jgi:hypothetical protein
MLSRRQTAVGLGQFFDLLVIAVPWQLARAEGNHLDDRRCQRSTVTRAG